MRSSALARPGAPSPGWPARIGPATAGRRRRSSRNTSAPTRPPPIVATSSGGRSWRSDGDKSEQDIGNDREGDDLAEPPKGQKDQDQRLRGDCGIRVRHRARTKRRPGGRTRSSPTIRTGRTCRRVRTATRPMPARNGPSSPVRLRVPSGNTSTLQPLPSRRSISSIESGLGPPRRRNANAPTHAAKNERRRRASKK